jgi:mRNA interferase MazF
MIVPKQWHLYTVNLEPRIGTKPGKQRPCLSIQPNEFGLNGLDSSVILPITTNLINNAFPLRVRVPKETAGLQKDSDIVVDQILAWDHNLFQNEIGKLPDFLIDEVKLALRDFLDL